MNNSHQQSHQIGMISFARDLPNICSLAGLLCAVLGFYFAVLKNFPAAIIGMIWAVLFDWGDGIIARKIKGRTDDHRALGGQLDSLIDMVSFGICPAVFLLSYGDFSPWFLPGAFVVVATSAIRLSYFNVFGLVDDSTYMGLALDNNVIILAFIFLFEGFFNPSVFSAIIYGLFLGMAVFNMAPVRTPKFSGKWFYVLMVYTVVLTIIYGLILWGRA
ncbi:MAG: CDP-alcohol phosphatidyltransferase family protein [Desulfobacula sp.]|nr:CDP-alcohol phosphatidyltransferase family protein [Desulfobacula sp.]